MKILNIGLIGYGLSGSTFHAPIIDCVPGLKISHIVSSNSKKVREKYKNVILLNKSEELFLVKDVDIVVITAPNIEHYSLAKKALLANKHVIVEKPFVTLSKDGEELVEIAKEKNLLLSVYHNRRFDNSFLTLKKILNDGELGNLYSFEAYFDRFRPEPAKDKWREQDIEGSGLLYDLGSHLIDQALQLFGMPEKIFADLEKQRENSQAIDYFELTLVYNKLRVKLGASSIRANPRPILSVHGDKGSYVKHGLDPQEMQLRSGKNPNSENWGVESQEFSGTLTTINDNLLHTQKIISFAGAYENYYAGIYDCIVNGKNNPVTAESALEVIKIIEFAILSHQTKQWIQILS